MKSSAARTVSHTIRRNVAVRRRRRGGYRPGAGGSADRPRRRRIIFQVGPTLLFLVWCGALVVPTLDYYSPATRPMQCVWSGRIRRAFICCSYPKGGAADVAIVPPYAAGITWCLEALNSGRGSAAGIQPRIRRGPPQL